MDISIFLAKSLGLYLLIFGLGMTLVAKKLRPILAALMKDTALVMMSGVLALIIGVLLVVSHNVWTADWRVLITIIAWLSLFKGIVRIFFPEVVTKKSEVILKNDVVYYAASGTILILGFYLLYVGFLMVH